MAYKATIKKGSTQDGFLALCGLIPCFIFSYMFYSMVFVEEDMLGLGLFMGVFALIFDFSEIMWIIEFFKYSNK